jgi:hypothetical protein
VRREGSTVRIHRNIRGGALCIGIISCLLGALGVLAAGPAEANCIRGEIVVHRSGQPDWTVWPESYCFHDTGNGEWITAPAGGTVTGLPTGMPNGARVTVWVPGIF